LPKLGFERGIFILMRSPGRLAILLFVLILLVGLLFFFEWMASEQPQKQVEIEVEPGIKPAPTREDMKD
jgi:hypothetical protein